MALSGGAGDQATKAIIRAATEPRLSLSLGYKGKIRGNIDWQHRLARSPAISAARRPR